MKIIFMALLSLCFSNPPAWAGTTEIDLNNMFETICQELQIPKNVAMAIAKVESGFNPWALNIEGKSFYFNSKEEALAKAQEALKAGKSFDSGVMQVNSWWLKKFDISLETALDPKANIYLGAWILKGELERHSTLKAAVGAYHSPNSNRANKYANVVMAAVNEAPTKKHSQKPASFKKIKSKPKTKNISSEFSMLPMLVKSQSAVLVENYKFRQSMKVSLRK